MAARKSLNICAGPGDWYEQAGLLPVSGQGQPDGLGSWGSSETVRLQVQLHTVNKLSFILYSSCLLEEIHC